MVPATSKSAFPIIGIGASAGGLEALELFFRNVPEQSGMAFVIVQHLDPTHVALLAELLQRVTPMPVAEIVDGTRVVPDHVYVIPPNKELSIFGGVLQLLAPVEARGHRRPIDSFFRALAADGGNGSVGVILSGMGTDGTLGLKAIKAAGGRTLVQEPASAKFDGMPASAVKSGSADVTAPVETLPAQIVALLAAPARIQVPAAAVDESLIIDKALMLLRGHTGHDFSEYKRDSVIRRVERRMSIHKIDAMSGYVRFLQGNPQELALLFKELLIGVSSFFRDADAWQLLRDRVVPELVRAHTRGDVMRAWVAACASGEEAYSLAIVFREVLDEHGPSGGLSIRIFATDLDADAIARARAGVYSASIATAMTPERLERYFVPCDRGFQVTAAIRETVTFAPHNLIMDPPFTKLDFASCRNLLIYLMPALQQKIVPLLHYTLNPGGVLFLGHAETIGTATDLFEPIDAKVRLYRRSAKVVRPNLGLFPTSTEPLRTGASVQQKQASDELLPTAAEQLILKQCAPPAVIVDRAGDIVYINGRTGRYLEPAAGKTNWNIFSMAREGLRQVLRDAFALSLDQKEAVVRRPVHLAENGLGQSIELRVQSIRQPGALDGLVLIVFVDIEPPLIASPGPDGELDPAGVDARSASLTQELSQLTAELTSTRQDARTSAEELSSTNEELQSTNEELQSTNEELLTSKEEMQSMNEELQTLNHELQTRLDELAQASNDVKNLLESTEIVTLFLDMKLQLRLFTAGTIRIFRLLPSDVGRPIADFASDLDYAALVNDAHEVLRRLISHQQEARTRDGRWYLVRIMPYRTLSNTVEGVAITFTDISTAKALEQKLRDTQAGLERHIDDQDVLLERAKQSPGAEIRS